MTEAEWFTATDPYRLTRHQEHRPPRKRRFLSCGLARGVLDLLPHGGYAAAVETAERFADRQATEAELRQAVAVVGHLAAGLPPTPAVAAVLATLAKPGVGVVHGLEPAAAARRAAGHEPAAIRRWQCDLARDVFGNPYRAVAADPTWLTSVARSLSAGIYAAHAFDQLPILADALQDAGCEDEQVLGHCRGPGSHVRGCWVVDLVLGK